MKMRIGFGYDVHGFEEGRPFVLGGVRIDFPKGLAGHSDADVLVHAIIDSILGAAGLGDIGKHFPPSDPAYKDISSLLLLERAMAAVKERGLEVVNVDATIVCEEPRLAPYIAAMEERTAGVMGCGPERVNIKATTEEGLGITGSNMAVKAYAVSLLDGMHGVR